MAETIKVSEMSEAANINNEDIFMVVQDGENKKVQISKIKENLAEKTYVDSQLTSKVDKVKGKNLSSNDFTNSYKSKLDSISEGAQVNTVTGIKGDSETTYRIGNVNITKDNLGLGNVENKSSANIREELTKSDVTKALGYTPPTTDTNTKYGLSLEENKLSLVESGSTSQVTISTNDTTYTLAQDSTDKHKLIFTPSEGNATEITMPDNNTTYSAGTGITLSGTTFSNSGVRSIATGSTNGTISVNTNGASVNVAVKGLGSLAYKSSLGASDVGAIPASAKGTANGVSTLDANGLVPASQLPSFVDDVVEGYYNLGKFYKTKTTSDSGTTYSNEITGESGKIYVDLNTNKTYRWSGTAFIVISDTITLGTTSSTAFRGDYGNTAYTHSQVTSGNPHKVTKADVGLGNVDNTADANKSVKYATSAGSATNATKVNNHTVEVDVPSGAKFTDTNTWTKVSTTTDGYIGKLSGSTSQFLRGDGTWASTPNTNTTYTLTQDANDGHKITLTPSSGTATTITIPDNNTQYSAATQTVAGLMSAADKKKLDGITGSGASTTVIDNLTSTSTTSALSANQGKVLNDKITNKVDKVSGKGLSTNDFTSTYKTKLDGIATGANNTTVTDNLTSTSTTNALSANQGRTLNNKILENETHKYKLIITENKSAGEEIVIPCKYKVGSDVLDVYLNGERLAKSSDDAGTDGHYCEIGTNGSISNKIKSTSDWNLESGDIINFTVRGTWS